MKYLSLFFIILRWVILWITHHFEKDEGVKQIKRDALDYVKQGIKERDPSKITQGFDFLR
jgi:hypothetical protein